MQSRCNCKENSLLQAKPCQRQNMHFLARRPVTCKATYIEGGHHGGLQGALTSSSCSLSRDQLIDRS